MSRLALILGLLFTTACGFAVVERADAGTAADARLDAPVDAGRDARTFGLYVGACAERRLIDGLGINTPPGVTCRNNGSCTTRANGICRAFEGDGGTIVQTYCRYDGCISDADCEPGLSCECSFDELRLCLRVECRADSDCADGQRCRRTRYGCSTDEELGSFLCTTDEDECLTHQDCQDNGLGMWCVPGSGHRVCISHTCD